MKKAALHNLGCKVNAYETEAMRELLEKDGYVIVPFDEIADVYVVNTCTVTGIADKKSRQMLHRAKKQNPKGVVVAVGCYAQMAAEKLLKDTAVDIVIGNNKKAELVPVLEEYLARHRQEGRSGQEDRLGSSRHGGGGMAVESALEVELGSSRSRGGGMAVEPALEVEVGSSRSRSEGMAVESASEVEGGSSRPGTEGLCAPAGRTASGLSVIDISRVDDYEKLSISRTSGHTRAFVKIQDGCNQFCSYCAIPLARGRVRSRSADDVVAEVEKLVGAGFQEIVLTGIHISSYGLDMPPESRVPLIQLLERLDGIRGLSRLRLGSLEPRIVTEDFVGRMARLRTICPHFHLSLQSGCDATLRRMNRHYTTGDYEAGCQILRRFFDRPAITTDVIVGFPGETEEEFAETVSFIKRIGFYETHIFSYSRREGTRAAAMPDQVEEGVKKARSAALLKLDREASLAYRKSQIGEVREVLMEEKITINGVDYLAGHTREYVKAAIPWDEGMGGSLVVGRIQGMIDEELLELSLLDKNDFNNS